jgi:hypothetical protein
LLSFCGNFDTVVIPAKAGIQYSAAFEIPAPASLEGWITRRSLSLGAHSRELLAVVTAQ